MDIIKASEHNDALLAELSTLEQTIKTTILSLDQSEFADETVQYDPCPVHGFMLETILSFP